MAVQFSVSASDRIGGYESLIPLLELNANYAASIWADQYVGGPNVILEISIDIVETPFGTADGASATSVFMFEYDGIDYWQLGTVSEIVTGVDPNGAQPDILIRIDPDYIDEWLYFSPSPSPSSPVPADKADALQMLLHELGHALAFYSFLDSSGVPTGGNKEAYDVFLKQIGDLFYFTGPEAEAAYGGPVPLHQNDMAHIGNDDGMAGEDLAGYVMYGPWSALGKTPGLSAVEIGIARDVLSVSEASSVITFDTVAVQATEGTGGTNSIVLNLARLGDTSRTQSVDYAVALPEDWPASASDFSDDRLPGGRITFDPGEDSKTVVINIVGDAVVEGVEAFRVVLSNPSAGVAIGSVSALVEVVDDDGFIAHDDAYIFPLPVAGAVNEFAFGSVLFNDEGAGSGHAVTLLSDTAHGSVHMNPDGSFEYSLMGAFSGIDTFTYRISADSEHSSDGTVNIYVPPVSIGATTTLNLSALTAEGKRRLQATALSSGAAS